MHVQLLCSLCGKSTTVTSQQLSLVLKLMILAQVVGPAKTFSTLFARKCGPWLLSLVFMLFMDVIQKILFDAVR